MSVLTSDQLGVCEAAIAAQLGVCVVTTSLQTSSCAPPIAVAVADKPVTVTPAPPETTDPPPSVVVAWRPIVTIPMMPDAVAPVDVTGTVRTRRIVSSPMADVAENPVTAIETFSPPQVLKPQVSDPHAIPRYPAYAILMIALLASAAGKVIVKSPAVEVLSAPKSSTNIDASDAWESLKINEPRAVIVAVDHVVSAKSVNAVVPDTVGVTRVRELPLAT